MKRTVYILVLLSVCFSGMAQINNTMYYMDRLPQANYINTGQVPEYKFFVGGLLVPVFGQLPPSMAIAFNTPLQWNDVFFKGRWDYKDSLITPLHPNADLNDFFKKIKKVNYISFDLHLPLLYFGFKQGENNFWTFDLSEKTFLHFGIPGDLFHFVIEGNGQARSADFSGLHMNFFHYHQLSLGYNRKINRYFSVGAKVKYLTGVANFYTSSSSIVLHTRPETNYISTTSNYVIHTNMPLEVALSENGFIDSLDFINLDALSPSDILKEYVLFTGNNGFAFDFGFSREWNSEITYFASIEDFGFIRWKKHPNTFSLIGDESNDGGFVFRGIEMNNLRFSELDFPTIDTIIDQFKFEYSQDPYMTWLPWKIYGGVQYKLTSKIYAGAVGRFEKLPYRLRSSYTFSLNYRPGKISHFTMSYSYINGNFNNLGFGYAFNLGPFQWYTITDNLIGVGLFPHTSRSASVRMGCNIVVGYKDEKVNRALPLFNTSGSTRRPPSVNRSQLGRSKIGMPKRKFKGSAVSAPKY